MNKIEKSACRDPENLSLHRWVLELEEWMHEGDLFLWSF